MYFIIEKTKLNDISIVGNFKDMTLKNVYLGNYLKEKEIPLIQSYDEVKKSGKYCIEISPIQYEIFDGVVSMDGYIFYGKTRITPLSVLHLIKYKPCTNKNRPICKEILNIQKDD